MRILYDNALLNRDVVLDMKLHESTLCDNGKIPDMSKYHNNATITGAVWTPPYGYTLDGVDDLLSAAQQVSIATAATLILCFKPTNLVANKGVMGWSGGAGAGWNSVKFGVVADSNSLVFNVSDGVGSNQIGLATSQIYQIIYASIDGSNLKFSINNGAIVSETQTRTPDISGRDLEWGRAILSGVSQFESGVFVESQVLVGKALTQAERIQHYLAAKRRMPWANLQ